MKRTQKRALSLIMTLALLLGLVPVMSIPAAAATVTGVTVGGAALSSENPYAVATTGDDEETITGATDKIHNVAFDSGTGTLTLSGVNLTSGIAFTGDAKIVLEGTNKITGTISCTGSLTIEGSGTLDVAPTTGSGISATSLTISSGYVTVTDSADTAVSVTGTMTVSGGYFVATSTSSSGSGISAATLSVTGGYVKATGGNTYAGVTSTTVTVSGGYLEASGAAGITGDVANSNGVIKAAGTAGNGITGTANCTGGVTIANGTGVAAISGNITGDSSELLFDNTGTSVATTGSALASSTLASVVIAKKVSTTQLADASLDGAYIYVTRDHVWKPASDATVAGGSYIYDKSTITGEYGCYPQASLTVTATLVVAGAGDGIYKNTAGSLTVSNTGNLIIQNNGRGIDTTSASACTLTNNGNIVSVTTNDGGIYISGGTINQNGGSIVSISEVANTYLRGINTKELNVTGGCVTAYGLKTLGISCFNLTQTGGAVTAVSKSGDDGINYNNLTDQSTTGAITVPNGKAVLGSTELYGSLKKTYRKTGTGNSMIRTSLSTTSTDDACVVFLSGVAPDPTVNVTAADSTALTAGDTSTTKTYNVTAKNIGRLYEVTYSSTISTIKWYSDEAGTTETTAPSGIYIYSGTTAATLSAKLTSTSVTPGNYYFRLAINDTEYTPNDVLTSNVVTLNVGKKTLSPTPTLSTTVSTAGTTGSTVTLPAPQTGGSYDTVHITSTDANGLINGTPTISGNTLTFNTNAKDAGTSATITIPVTGCTDYQDYDIVVTVTSSAFGATLSGNVTGYTDVALSSQTVTVTLTGDTFAASLTTSGWVKNLPTGLTTSVTRTSDTVATITFTGRPTAASTAPIAVTIPANCITSHTTAYEVPTNASAAYAITASTYTMTLTAGTPNTFADLTYGYTTGNSVTYTITNTGNQKLTNLRASMSSGNNSSFNYTLSAYNNNIPVGGTATVTVTSKTGLNVGTYTDTLTVSAYNVSTANAPTASLSQTVTKADYSGTVTKTVTVYCGSANTGTVTMADLFGTTIPTDAAFGTVTPPSGTLSVMSTVAANDTDTAKLDYTSLSAATAGSSDTYTATITSKNYNDITATITFTAQNPAVTFDACGGAWTDSAVIKTATISGGAVTKPENPTFTGYTFVGWYTDKYYTTAFANSGLTANTTVYAMWKRTSDDVILRNTALYFKGDGKLYETLDPYAKTPDLHEVNTTTVPGWSAATTTLTLSGLSFLTQNDTGLYIYTDTAKLTLADGTTNTIQSVCTDSWSCGVYGYAESLTIDGSGTLNAAGGDVSGINYNESTGIEAYGSIIIDSGTVNATGGKSAEYSIGIYGSYVTINGGTVNATGGTSTATSSKTGSTGILCTDITVTGGTVTATGGTVETGAYSVGILAKGSKTSTAAFTGGTTNASGKTASIAAVNDITVTNVAITKPASGTVGTFDSLKTVLEGTTPALSATIGQKQSAGTTPDTSKDSTVVVDGKPVSAGKVTTSTNSDGTKNNNVAVDSTILEKQVAVADNGSSVIVTVPVSTGSASAQLVVKDVEKLDAKDMPLEIKVGDTSYTIAPNAIDTAKVAAELGATDTGKVPLTVTVTPVKQSDVSVSKGTQIAEPVKFTVTAEYNGKTVAVDSFNRFVSRLIEIPENVAANMITTGIRVEDGEHVPTEVIQQGGRYFAKINSLTNSTYTVIYNKAGFADTAGKWYNDVVTEMASRTIVNGKTSTVFDGDGSITRAEFAAILVRALGLPEGKTSQFSDTAKSAWYYGSVSTATQYGIIKGYSDGSFKPGANITREEAMAMMQRAAKVAGYAGTTGTLTGFSDASSVGAWAKSAVAYNVGSGLIQGNAGKLNPKNSITRAETAVVVLRLLQKAKLVDVRTKA